MSTNNNQTLIEECLRLLKVLNSEAMNHDLATNWPTVARLCSRSQLFVPKLSSMSALTLTTMDVSMLQQFKRTLEDINEEVQTTKSASTTWLSNANEESRQVQLDRISDWNNNLVRLAKKVSVKFDNESHCHEDLQVKKLHHQVK